MMLDKAASESNANTIDRAEFRHALGSFVTGITVVTCQKADGDLYGMTVNSFNSVSLDPPLVLWSLDNSSTHHTDFATGFVVNILSAEQKDLCNQFASSDEDARFKDVDYRIGASGHPVIENALASFECKPWAVYEGGDHHIYVGEVVGLHKASGPALTFFQGKIGQYPPEEIS